jgi:hypothetical protein
MRQQQNGTDNQIVTSSLMSDTHWAHNDHPFRTHTNNIGCIPAWGGGRVLLRSNGESESNEGKVWAEAGSVFYWHDENKTTRQEGWRQHLCTWIARTAVKDGVGAEGAPPRVFQLAGADFT